MPPQLDTTPTVLVRVSLDSMEMAGTIFRLTGLTAQGTEIRFSADSQLMEQIRMDDFHCRETQVPLALIEGGA